MKTRLASKSLLLLAAASWLALSGPIGAQDIRILVTGTYYEGVKDLADHLPNLEIVTASSSEEILEKVVDCDAIVGLTPGPGVGPVVRAGKKLKWVQSMSAGAETFVSVPELRDGDILLTNAKIIQGPEIADHAFALLLNLTRDLKFYNEQMKVGFRRGNRLELMELPGKTVFIIGLGGIGTQVAQRAAGFGMRVIAIDPKDIPLHRDVAYLGKPNELNRLLPQADVVISCVPHTPETEGMIGREQFELMKEGVYLINVSRGAVVDTEALTDALRSGKVRAAGLDVTSPEPLPPDHPLWSMPNVTITPHIAGRSDGIGERRLRLFRDNIENFVRGRPMRNVVNKFKGY